MIAYPTQPVHFITPTVLDSAAFTVFGLSNKPNSTNPIGYFGTGLKYAIATLLRHGAALTIQTRNVTHQFTVDNAEFRDHTYSRIRLSSTVEHHGEQTELDPLILPFTTSLGKNWQLWQAYRELWSNTMDEQGSVAVGEHTHEPQSTTITVALPEFSAVHEARSSFLLTPQNREALSSTPQLEIYPGSGPAVFYRGIKVTELPKPAQYTYNLLSPQTLTEDRTLDSAAASLAVAHALTQLPDRDLLVSILTAPDSAWESKLDFTYCPQNTASQEFTAALAEALKEKDFNASALAWARCKGLEEAYPPSVPITPVHRRFIVGAKGFLAALGMADPWTHWSFATLDYDWQQCMTVNKRLFLSPTADHNKLLHSLLTEWNRERKWSGPGLEQVLAAFAFANGVDAEFVMPLQPAPAE